jgi:hypothetical protein
MAEADFLQQPAGGRQSKFPSHGQRFQPAAKSRVVFPAQANRQDPAVFKNP